MDNDDIIESTELAPPDPNNPEQVAEYISNYLRTKVLGKHPNEGGFILDEYLNISFWKLIEIQTCLSHK